MAGCGPPPSLQVAGQGLGGLSPQAGHCSTRVAVAIHLGGHAHVSAFVLGVAKGGVVLGKHLEGGSMPGNESFSLHT